MTVISIIIAILTMIVILGGQVQSEREPPDKGREFKAMHICKIVLTQ